VDDDQGAAIQDQVQRRSSVERDDGFFERLPVRPGLNPGEGLGQAAFLAVHRFPAEPPQQGIVVVPQGQKRPAPADEAADQAQDAEAVRAAIRQVPQEDQVPACGVVKGLVITEGIAQATERVQTAVNVADDVVSLLHSDTISLGRWELLFCRRRRIRRPSART